MAESDRDRVHIIDGGVGTEIQKRGLSPDPCYWTAMAHIHAPDVLLDIYLCYIEAGADIISTNSFMAGRHILAAGGIGEFEHVNRESVRIARRAVEQCGRTDVRVAGTLSILPVLNQADDLPRGADIDANFDAQAEILADEGADLLLAEMLIDSTQGKRLLQGCCRTGLPVWAGVSAFEHGDGSIMAFRSPGKLEKLGHETFDSLLSEICTMPVQAIGVMHTDCKLMPQALERLVAHWRGDKFAYAKTGGFSEQDWRFTDIVDPGQYATMIREWSVDYRLDAVGGCCGTNPDHIRQISHCLQRDHRPRSAIPTDVRHAIRNTVP